MERLTTHKNENYNQPGCNDCSDYRWRNCKKSGEIKDCIKRLTWIRLLVIEDILGNDYDLDRLRELVNADREGRCVVLQYKKNDVAYSIKHNPFIRKVVVRQMLVDTDNGVVWYHCIDDFWNPDFFVSCDIGKTVFKTREEAESALKERNGN